MKSKLSIISLALLSLLLGACASYQPQTMSTSVTDREQAFNCVMSQLASMQYIPTQVDRDSGFVRAEKKTSGVGMVIMAGANMFDEITVTIYDDAGAESTVLRLAAGSLSERAMGWSTGQGTRQYAMPRAQVVNEAKAILKACGSDS